MEAETRVESKTLHQQTISQRRTRYRLTKITHNQMRVKKMIQISLKSVSKNNGKQEQKDKRVAS